MAHPQLAFELPFGNFDVAEELINAVPPNWNYLSGQLDAPFELLTQAGLVARAGYSFKNRWSAGIMTLRDSLMYGYNAVHSQTVRAQVTTYQREALMELVGERRLPGFILFEKAGEKGSKDEGPISLQTASAIALSYIRQGYTGDLEFHAGKVGKPGESDSTTSRCDIHLAPYEEANPQIPESRMKSSVQLQAEIAAARASGDEAMAELLHHELVPPKRNFPPLITLQWDPNGVGGCADDVAPISQACRRLNLQPLEARYIEYGTSTIKQLDL